MKQLTKSIMFAAALTVSAGAAMPVMADNAQTLDQLLQQVKKDRISEKKVNKKREAEFLSDRSKMQSRLNKSESDLAASVQRGEDLKAAFSANEQTIVDKETELENAKGTLGEMFGVVRQASGEAVGRISTSVVSAQYPNRTQLLEKLSEAKKLPSLVELEDLWFALQTEMTESGKVVRFKTDVTKLDGNVVSEEIIRIGSFGLIGEEGFLRYDAENEQVQPLGRQPDSHMVSSTKSFLDVQSGLAPLYIDPSRGQILGLLTQKATLTERYHEGGVVGYIITAVLFIGLLIALERIIVLTLMGGKIRAQLKNLSNPSDKNPLGRILKVGQENKDADVETLELKLDEAVLRELPKIERGVSLIKIFAAIAPLLGLLGTVTGMIGTFQSITLFGTGDPKIMAGSISMALVTTAQGLIAALPLILAHSLAAGRAKTILSTLDERSAGIVAAHAEQEKA
ncbi:MotA/TolQ/ExbB proton channel family protein [Echinimonas agarilytica]|uniref:MotA/TolQ/ExbB proton channel family protein n=1 Tax=Echinimonas agarilytica TaxID=1215918 RepID=A0AA42B7Y0_9GAMM|nr:MotA/TolQ/ExbB proton channel family protein [Echinimonas agarilytica]MCM2679823.1 MotA/TolQ/ExbB proton channel family protein [Echinimonas agarilytica]